MRIDDFNSAIEKYLSGPKEPVLKWTGKDMARVASLVFGGALIGGALLLGGKAAAAIDKANWKQKPTGDNVNKTQVIAQQSLPKAPAPPVQGASSAATYPKTKKDDDDDEEIPKEITPEPAITGKTLLEEGESVAQVQGRKDVEGLVDRLKHEQREVRGNVARTRDTLHLPTPLPFNPKKKT